MKTPVLGGAEEFVNKERIEFFLVSKVKDHRVNGKSIIFRCQAAPQVGTLFDAGGYFLNIYKEDKSKKAKEVTVRLDICSPYTFRLRMNEGSKIIEKKTPMVINDFKEPVKFTVTGKRKKIVIKTEIITIHVSLEPWDICAQDINGNLFFKEKRTDPWKVTDFIPLALAIDPETGQKAVFESVECGHDEHFYGLGEKFGYIDKRNQPIDTDNADCVCTMSQRSYKNIPFHMSTKGYGLYLNSSHKIHYRMATHSYNSCTFQLRSSLLDYYVIYGPSFKDILSRYTDITGKSPVPPKWSFGLWMSRGSYTTRKITEEVADKLRKRDIPCDVLHLDTAWFKKDWVCDLRFSKERFPNPGEMFEKLKEKGFKVSLWQFNCVPKGSANYKPGKQKGYFVKKSDGSVYHVGQKPLAIIDFTNPEAVDWYVNKLRRLIKMGAAVIKTDFGEGIPSDGIYAYEDGNRMHNLYPLFYNKPIFEMIEEETGRGIVWARSAYAGSQRWPVHWAGDPVSDFPSLAACLRGGLSLGLSGFTYWSHDIGGFQGTPSKELYIRWAQVGFFSSHARCHGAGNDNAREPWAYGQDAEKIFRNILKLRYRLIPYIYSNAYQCSELGLPMLKAMVLEFPDDPTTYSIDDQYLFGDSFLVAPILDENNRRKIYLPEGNWTDYWTKKIYRGRQWIQYEASLEIIPLFVRAGSIIPMGPDMSYIGQKECDPITLDVYLGSVGEFKYRDDHEEFRILLNSKKNKIEIKISKTTHRFVIKINNIREPSLVKVRGKKLETRKWTYLKKRGIVNIPVEANGGSIKMEVFL